MGRIGSGSGAIDQILTYPNLDRGVLSWLGNHTTTASCLLSKGESFSEESLGSPSFQASGVSISMLSCMLCRVSRVPAKSAWAFPSA